MRLSLSDWGGNFYLDGEHGFTTPESLSGWTRQILTFMPGEWRESVFRLADFTVQVDVDSSRIGEIVDALQIIPADFTDTTGENFFYVYTHVSQLAIDGVTRTEEQISEPIIFAHRPAYPDPFNASTTISFESATGGEVRLSIFDINGRLVRAFGARKVSPGKNSIIWEGTNNNNGSLSSGIYIYRIERGDNVAAARVTLLK